MKINKKTTSSIDRRSSKGANAVRLDPGSVTRIPFTQSLHHTTPHHTTPHHTTPHHTTKQNKKTPHPGLDPGSPAHIPFTDLGVPHRGAE